jgi:uncharacterized protein YkwD
MAVNLLSALYSAALSVVLLLALLGPATAASDETLSLTISKLAGAEPSLNHWPGGNSLDWVQKYYLPLPTLQGELEVYSDTRAQQYADEIFRMTNEARAKKGHPPLKRSPQLDAVSQAHAVHMAERDFFEHEDPYGLSAWDRMEAADCPDYWLSGENIAAGYRNAAEAHQSWMDSGGHRKNIRRDEYEYIGIGVYYDEDSEFGWYWVQTFATFSENPDSHDWIEPGEACPF